MMVFEYLFIMVNFPSRIIVNNGYYINNPITCQLYSNFNIQHLLIMHNNKFSIQHLQYINLAIMISFALNLYNSCQVRPYFLIWDNFTLQLTRLFSSKKYICLSTLLEIAPDANIVAVWQCIYISLLTYNYFISYITSTNN